MERRSFVKGALRAHPGIALPSSKRPGYSAGIGRLIMRCALAHELVLTFVALSLSACNAMTGAGQYEEVSRCTGPLCGVCPSGQAWDPASESCIAESIWCTMQGGLWDPASQDCLPPGTCPSGQTWDPSREQCVDDAAWCVLQGGQWGAERLECIPAGSCPTGERWWKDTCVLSCGEGKAECGPSCCGIGLNCVDLDAQKQCSTCDTADRICNQRPSGEERCCEAGSECTNPGRGVCSADYGVEGQSCVGGLTCNGESCCTSIEVPAGTFEMGSPESDPEAYKREFPEHTVVVSAFKLDKYEVTEGRFHAFLERWDYKPPPAGAGAHPRIADSGWRGAWDDKLPKDASDVISCGGSGDPALPIACVTWYTAFVFCVWDGGRLPTEAEWEYAAAGGSENRRYPWGAEAPTADRAVFDATELALVGSKPPGAGRWGHLDLGGNLWEWVLDDLGQYDAAACDDCADVPEEGDCADVSASRSIRGGSYMEGAALLRAATRSNMAPSKIGGNGGFRCAGTP